MPKACRLLAIILSLLMFSAGLMFAAANVRAQGTGMMGGAMTGVMTMPGEACTAPAKEDWSDAEKWAWGKLCVGDTADMSEFAPGPDDPAKDESWPDGRILSTRFLDTILLVEPYRSAIPNSGIAIRHARFPDYIDLSNASLIRSLWLWDSRFDNGIDMLSLHSTAPLSFDGSHFKEDVDLQRAQIDGSVFMRKVTASKVITMTAARIGNSLSMVGASVTGDLELDVVTTGGAIFLKSIDEKSGLDISGSHIGDMLDLDGAHVAGNTNLQRMVVSGALFAGPDHDRPCLFAGGVDMLGANIGGGAEFRGATIHGELLMEQTSVGGDLWLAGEGENRGAFDEVNMLAAHVGTGVLIHKADFHGPVSLDDAHIGQHIEIRTGVEFFKPVEMIRARVDSDVEIGDTTFDDKVEMRAIQVGDSVTMNPKAVFALNFDLAFARIGNNLDLTNGAFATVDLTGATIASEIRLGSPLKTSATWDKHGKLTLRNASAGALQDLPSAKDWPAELDLEGFAYTRIGGFGSSVDALGERDTGDFTAWLAKETPYSPQSYIQLATVFRNSGFPDKADWILFQGKLREMFNTMTWDEKHIPRPDRFFFLFVYCITTGFGIYPQLATIWVILFIVIGAHIFGHDKEPALVQMNWVDRAIYSLDMLIPVVHLRGKNYTFEPQSNHVRYYLYVHRFIGFLLATVLIASLSHGSVEFH